MQINLTKSLLAIIFSSDFSGLNKAFSNKTSPSLYFDFSIGNFPFSSDFQYCFCGHLERKISFEVIIRLMKTIVKRALNKINLNSSSERDFHIEDFVCE